MSVPYKDLELPLFGLTFLVSGEYSPPEPQSGLNPSYAESFDITSVRIQGLPGVDPEDLLYAIKQGLFYSGRGSIGFGDGFDLLTSAALEAVGGR